MSETPPTASGVSWPSALVAVAVIAVVGAVAVTAIVKYASVDDALKFWSALSGLVGLITGAFVAYFFTRENVRQAQADKERALQLSSAAVAGRTAALQAAGVLAGHLDRDEFDQLKQCDPAVRRVFNP